MMRHGLSSQHMRFGKTLASCPAVKLEPGSDAYKTAAAITCALIQYPKTKIDVQDVKRSYALHIAVKANNSEVIFELSKRGARVDVKDDQGSTPLHHILYEVCTSGEPRAEANALMLIKGKHSVVKCLSWVCHPGHLPCLPARTCHDGQTC